MKKTTRRVRRSADIGHLLLERQELEGTRFEQIFLRHLLRSPLILGKRPRKRTNGKDEQMRL
jgi:hypothetical protein